MYNDKKFTNIEDITAVIAARRVEVTDLSIRVSHMEEDIEGRKIEITPDAWAGSNDSTRKLSETKCFQADPVLINLRSNLRDLRDKLAVAESELDSLRDRRRCEENQIKIYLADSIHAMVYGPELMSAAVEETLEERERYPINNARDEGDIPF